MPAPALSGISHLSLSIRDLDASVAFYRDILGLTVFVEPYDGEVFAGRQALLLAGRVVVGLQQHDANEGVPFDPTRTGLDHLSFHVASREELDAWSAWLDDGDVEHSEVKQVGDLGWMIELRDPDGIQLELFATA